MRRPEEALQRLCVDYASRAYPKLILFAVTNQKGTRSAIEMAILKSMGAKPGVSDLVLCLPNGRFAAIELKAPKGRLSDSQSDFLAAVELTGGYTAVVRSIDEFAAVLGRWLAPQNWVARARI